MQFYDVICYTVLAKYTVYDVIMEPWLDLPDWVLHGERERERR